MDITLKHTQTLITYNHTLTYFDVFFFRYIRLTSFIFSFSLVFVQAIILVSYLNLFQSEVALFFSFSIKFRPIFDLI